jgi:hypothetical protein
MTDKFWIPSDTKEIWVVKKVMDGIHKDLPPEDRLLMFMTAICMGNKCISDEGLTDFDENWPELLSGIEKRLGISTDKREFVDGGALYKLSPQMIHAAQRYVKHVTAGHIRGVH